MKHIPLSKNKIALVDDDDFVYLSQFNWCIRGPEGSQYAGRISPRVKGEKYRCILMHRVILDAKDGFCVDHIDGNTLNNQKSNLRICTPKQNFMSRRIRSDNRSNYKGVSWHKASGKWAASGSLNGKSKHLGLFDKIEDAAKEYNKHAKSVFGEFAKLNTIIPDPMPLMQNETN